MVIAAVLGLTAALVIWAPWVKPPLLRPTGLTAGPATASSVTVRWPGPATGPAPDRYVILRDGNVIGSVPGTVTSYRDTGLAPAARYQYRVAAERSGHRSAPSPVLVAATLTPPVSAARLAGPWTISIEMVRGREQIQGMPRQWNEYQPWLASPKCTAGPCAVALSGQIGGHPFTVTLARAGAVYTGKTTANMFPCGSGPGSFPLRDTLTFRITLTTAAAVNRAWMASSWTGTMNIYSPYTVSGDYYCTAGNLTASLSGNPSS